MNYEATAVFNILKKNLTTEGFFTILKKLLRTLPEGYCIINSGIL